MSRTRFELEWAWMKRTKLDWTLEILAFAALLGIVFVLVTNWNKLPVAPRPSRWKYPGAPEPWNVRTALPIMGGIGVFGYIGMSVATHYERLIQVPEQLRRAAPHMRQLVFSMGIMLKAVLMLVSLYLVWALVNAAQGQFVGLGRRYITGLVLTVLVPIAIYGVKLFRQRE